MKKLSCLIYWYMRFAHIWVMSLVLFYAFLYVSTIYNPYVFGGQVCEDPVYCLLWLRFSRLDYMLLFFSTLFVLSILFTYEYEQGYKYIVFTSRYRVSVVFVYKLITLTILVVLPYIAAKVVALVFSDPSVVYMSILLLIGDTLFLFIKQVLYILYISGFILVGTIVIRKLSYNMIFYTLYFILFESPLSIHTSILRLFHSYVSFYISTDFTELLDFVVKNHQLFIASAIAFAVSYIVYSRYEVKT